MAKGRKLTADVIHHGKMYLKGSHTDLPEDFPDEETLKAKLDKAGKTEGLRVSARQAAAGGEDNEAGDELDLDEIEEGEPDEEGEEGEEDGAGKLGNEAGMKGNSGKERTKPKGRKTTTKKTK